MSPSPFDRTLPEREPTSPSAAAWKAHATATVVHATLAALVDAVPVVTDPLAAALLGSDACGVWWAPAEEADTAPHEFERLIGRAYAAHLEQLADDRALAALRALQVGGSDGVVPEVAAAAERLARAGHAEPPWWPTADRTSALRGARVSWSDDGHEYTSHLLEVDCAGDVLTMAVATLDDCSGVVGDILLFTDLDGFEHVVTHHGDARLFEWTGADVARTDIRRAIDRTDLLGTGHPPGSSEPEVGYVALRALAQRWTA